MTALKPGDKALTTYGYTVHVGTITDTDPAGGYILKAVSGATWTVSGDALTLLDADTPLLAMGDVVQIKSNNIHHPNRAGKISEPAFRRGKFGYYVWLIVPTEKAWIPAAHLTPINLGGVS